MADNTGTTVGAGVGAVGGSLFGPVGTAVGSGIGGLIGSLFNSNPAPNNNGAGLATAQASQDLQEANANQEFWNNVYSQFNPTAPTITATPSGSAYANIANNAKSMFNNSLNANGGPTGNIDQNQVGQNLATKGIGASKTQDINDYMSDTAQNQQSAEQKELSMFGGAQNQNAENTALFQTAPENALMGQANTATQEGNAWNTYNENQPNFGNEFAGAAGGAAGKIIGGQLSNSMFGNNGSTSGTESEEEESPGETGNLDNDYENNAYQKLSLS